MKAFDECTSIDDVLETLFDEYVKFAPLDDPTTCRDDLEKTVPTLDSIVEDIMKEDWTNLMIQATLLFSEVQTLVPVCTPTNLNEFNFVREVDAEACEKDTTDLLDMVYNVVDMFLNGEVDPVKLVLWLTGAFSDGKKMVGECEDVHDVFEGIQDEYFVKFHVVNQESCHTTLDKTYDTGFDLYNSVVSQDWTKVIIDVTTLYTEVQDVVSFCTPAAFLFAAEFQLGEPWNGCQLDLEEMMDKLYDVG